MLGFADYSLMWVLLSATVAIKGLNYALNKPTAEVMYIPTSKDVKFKAKGWIDMFGNRSTKGMGATVTNSFGHSFPALILYGTIISLGVLGVWIVVARYVGNKFDRLQETGDTVE
jgi:AAA family ATP:ADP antiporter